MRRSETTRELWSATAKEVPLGKVIQQLCISVKQLRFSVLLEGFLKDLRF